MRTGDKPHKIDNSISRLLAVSALWLIGVLCMIAAFAKSEKTPARHLLLPRAAGEQTAVSTSDTVNTEAAATPSPNWKIKHHGECCEGNLAAAGNNVYVLLPVLVNGNRILKSADGGNTWVQKYPPAPASVPFGIEGDMQAYGTDVIFFGTELGVAITAHSDDFGETFIPVQNPLASAGNDQAWSYLGPFSGLRPGGALPTDEPYVLAGWMRIGSVVAFSFDGGLTFPIQTPLVGDDGSGPSHVVCQQTAHAPTSPGDTRVADENFANHKAGRHGAWGTDRKFYWTETSNGAVGSGSSLYVCKTDNFGATWTGIQHPIVPGGGSGYVVTHTGFDNKGTLYVLHGDQLYVSFNQGESFAFTHTLPRFGNALLSDSGADQFFVVNCGTIHIGLITPGAGGKNEIYYLRGSHVDTANPTWDEELVDAVDPHRLDFMQIVLDGNGIPTMSYTTLTSEVTTATRNAPLPLTSNTDCPVVPLNAVSRKVHGAAGTFDVDLPLTGPVGIECRTGGSNGDHQIVVTFPKAVRLNTATVSAGSGSVSGLLVSGSTVTVNLTGVANAQRIAVTLFSVTDGAKASDVVIPMGVLAGDTTADTFTNSADIAQTKSQSGHAVDGSNFREDVTIDGNLNSGDIALVKSKSGTALP